MTKGFYIVDPFAKARLYDGVYVCQRCKRKFRWNKKKGTPKCPRCGYWGVRQKKLPYFRK